MDAAAGNTSKCPGHILGVVKADFMVQLFTLD